jgi:hypothetical protein
MTDDLVKRLACFNDGNALPSTIELLTDMQARIEALEKALQLIADACAENEWPDGTQQIARAALGEKKDD